MKTKLRILVITVAMFLPSMLFGQQPGNAELSAKMLSGSWRITSGLKGGEKSDASSLPSEIVVTEKTFTIPAGPDMKFVMSYKLNASKAPVHIDLVIEQGPVNEGSAVGIIKMDGGKLVLCYNAIGGERPEKFESNDSNGYYLFVMEKNSPALNSQQLVGTWKYESGKRAGEVSPPERLAGEVKITQETITVPAGPDSEFVFAYKIDSTKSPVQVDLEIKEGPVSEGEAKGIIKLENGKLVLCYNPMGEARPENFESTDDNGFFMFTLTQLKK